MYLEKVSGKIVSPVLTQDREHIEVSLKEHYLTLWMFEEQICYFVLFHLYSVCLYIFKIWDKF